MRSILLAAVFVMTAFFSFSQTKTEQLKNVNVSSTKAVHLGKTQPVRDLIRVGSTDRNKKAETKKRITAAPANFIGRAGSNVTRPELEHQGVDPIRQKGIANGRIVATVDPIVNIDGLASSFGSPNDPTGDVGLDYYVQAINATDIAVYDKTDGTLVEEFAANTLWSPINESSAGDPIILFDHEYNRWIITEFTHPSGTANLLFAISETSDPLGSYNVYAFSPPSFPDYPKWAIWSDTYMVTTNEGGPGALHQYFFDRAAFLAGDAEVTMQRVEITGNTSTEAGFYVSTPVSWIGDIAPADNKPIAVKINDSSWGEVANDAIEVFIFDVDFVNGTTVSKTTIETTPFDGYPCDTETGGFACLAQDGSSSGIDAIPEVIMNLPHYRNFGTHESIVLSFITDVDNGNNLSGIRWVELRRTSGDWGLYQEGTYAPADGLHRFMPSISMDKDGNMGLAYNTTSDSEFVGIKYTGRYAEDPLGTMTVPEYSVVSGTGSVSGDRFGDYAQMGIDPQNERTFWYTSEYAATGGSKTRIVSFQLEENANDLTVVSIDEPNTSTTLSATETVTATVKNIGTQDVLSFDLILRLDGTIEETYSHSTTLAAGATLQHNFGSTIDLSAFGKYEISVEVDFAGDEVEGNDVMTKMVSKLAENDASISANGLNETCTDNLEIELKIKNEGGTTLESADIEISLNAVLVETINWTGSLETGKSENESISLSGLIVGNNAISIELTNPNGVSDEITDDNTAVLNVNLVEGMDQITLILNADEYPEETTWELLDSESGVIASGGPYNGLAETTITEVLCVEPDACYEFVIYDAYDDGICCEYGNGSYSIVDGSGTIIFEGNGQFGSSESSTFCIGQECNLAVSVTSQNANFQSGGSILIDASGSYGYEYSIDNGVTFQESAVFDELESGSYEVAVRSQSGGCSYTETVTIDYILNVSLEDQQVKIAPNPTEGVFKISVPGHDYINGFLEVNVIDMNGRMIQNHRFSRYDKAFEGTISLYAYPDGIYFLKLMNAKTGKLVKIIKQ